MHRSLLAAASLLAATTVAHADMHGIPADLLGRPASPRASARVITVILKDNRFHPARIQVKDGQTVRFHVVNKDPVVHEFSFATPAEQNEHRMEMTMMANAGMVTADRIVSTTMRMPNGTMMKHDDPNALLLAPGKTGDIAWNFTKPGTLQLACNMPGHFESGMKGRLTVMR